MRECGVFFQNANYIFYFYFHNASVKGGKIMETNISTVQVVLMGLNYRVRGPDLLDCYHQDPRPHHGEGR